MMPPQGLRFLNQEIARRLRAAQTTAVTKTILDSFQADMFAQGEDLLEIASAVNIVQIMEERAKAPKRLILIVHGIRTFAEWADAIRAEWHTNDGVVVVPLGYDFFDLVRFWLPLGTRGRPIRTVETKIRNAVSNNPGRELTVIAHSFGTYIISKLLRSNGDIRIKRLVLCGSVIENGYPWHLVPNRPEITNDCGSRDKYPVFASFFSWGYGTVGLTGFRCSEVEDRFHDLDHSGYLNVKFANQYWLPFILDGECVKSPLASNRGVTPYYLSVMSATHFTYPFIAVGVCYGLYKLISILWM